MIDDKRFDRSFARLESQAEPFLERSEYRGRTCWVRRELAIVGLHKRHTGHLGSLSREFDVYIESAGDSGFVNHRTVNYQE